MGDYNIRLIVKGLQGLAKRAVGNGRGLHGDSSTGYKKIRKSTAPGAQHQQMNVFVFYGPGLEQRKRRTLTNKRKSAEFQGKRRPTINLSPPPNLTTNDRASDSSTLTDSSLADGGDKIWTKLEAVIKRFSDEEEECVIIPEHLRALQSAGEAFDKQVAELQVICGYNDESEATDVRCSECVESPSSYQHQSFSSPEQDKSVLSDHCSSFRPRPLLRPLLFLQSIEEQLCSMSSNLESSFLEFERVLLDNSSKRTTPIETIHLLNQSAEAAEDPIICDQLLTPPDLESSDSDTENEQLEEDEELLCEVSVSNVNESSGTSDLIKMGTEEPLLNWEALVTTISSMTGQLALAHLLMEDNAKEFRDEAQPYEDRDKTKFKEALLNFVQKDPTALEMYGEFFPDKSEDVTLTLSTSESDAEECSSSSPSCDSIDLIENSILCNESNTKDGESSLKEVLLSLAKEIPQVLDVYNYMCAQCPADLNSFPWCPEVSEDNADSKDSHLKDLLLSLAKEVPEVLHVYNHLYTECSADLNSFPLSLSKSSSCSDSTEIPIINSSRPSKEEMFCDSDGPEVSEDNIDSNDFPLSNETVPVPRRMISSTGDDKDPTKRVKMKKSIYFTGNWTLGSQPASSLTGREGGFGDSETWDPTKRVKMKLDFFTELGTSGDDNDESGEGGFGDSETWDPTKRVKMKLDFFTEPGTSGDDIDESGEGSDLHRFFQK